MKTWETTGRGRMVIAGGSGFLGRALSAAASSRGYEVVVLSRDAGVQVPGARVVQWDGRTRGAWVKELEGAEAVVNLAGKNVNCRYGSAALKAIDASRVDSTRVLGDAMHGCLVAPKVWVQSGTLAIHGDAGDRWCDEDAPAGDGVPARTARRWERAWVESPTPRTRRVLLRMAFVLGRDAGAMKPLQTVVQAFLGGSIGGGRQFVSWIHITDMMRVFLRAVEDASMAGVYVASSPEPVRNAVFMKTLRRAVGRPWAPPTPSWMVKLGCWLLRTEPVLALTGRRGDPRRLEEAGFTFRFPTLSEAIADLHGGRELTPVDQEAPVFAVKVREGRFY